MVRKAAFAVAPALALALFAAAPGWAMSIEVSPLNPDGSPRFIDPGAAPRTFRSGPNQVTTTFGSGSFTFGMGMSAGINPRGNADPNYDGPPPNSPYYTGPSSSGLSNPAFSTPALPGSEYNQITPFLYAPPPVNHIDPNRPR
jgi:hypothetical protein